MNDVYMELTPESQQRITTLLQYIDNSMDTKTGSKLHKLLVEGANEIATAAKTSSDMPVLTGRLRASVHAKTKSTDNYSYSNNKSESFNGSLHETVRDGSEAVIGTNVNYAFTQETKHQFLYGALQKVEPWFIKNLDKMAKDTLNKK